MTLAGDQLRPDQTQAQGTQARETPTAVGEAQAGRRLARTLRRARLSLLWEEAWRRLAPVLGVAGLFVAVSWLGLWRLTNVPVRLALLALFAAVLLAALWRLARLPGAGAEAALARVEAATGLDHRPATAFGDALATETDPAARRLWRAHRERIIARLHGLKAGAPRPDLATRDPYALRFAVVLVLVVGFVVAGPERQARVAEAFLGIDNTAEAVARVDAWVTPPSYTARPPLFLTGEFAAHRGTIHVVPSGSVLTVRVGDGDRFEIATNLGAGAARFEPQAPGDNPGAPVEHRIELTSDQDVTIRRSGRRVLGWQFRVEPDEPPTVAFQGAPETTDGALRLAYDLADDYGVVTALGELAPVTGADGVPARPLYRPPTLPLNLPQLRTRDGTGQTERNLAAHPWAGAEVDLTLVARDEVDQEGRSETMTLELPSRRFNRPLARAIVEQRSNLALDANAREHVAEALDALTLPGVVESAGNHLALRSAYRRLVLARDDDGLRDVVDYLWEIALGVEQGSMSPLQQRLADAQEALREALENGASDEEIARLTEELRAAMQDYLRALAEQALQNPQLGNPPRDLNAPTLDSDDLERLLDRIEDLAQSGARDAAQQLLSELQAMLENLQAGRPLFGDDPQLGEMMEGLNELGDIIRRQEELMNRTFRADREQAGEGQASEGQDGAPTREQLEEALRQLGQQQGDLADQLRELLEGLADMGGAEQLGRAGEEMGQAAGQLGEGAPGAAVGSQGRALEALRQGSQALMEQLAEMGQQPGNGPGNQGQLSGTLPPTDPLGRPRSDNSPDLGASVRVPDEIDAQRAREILEAIRRRLSETGRTIIEREYLERLLERF